MSVRCSLCGHLRTIFFRKGYAHAVRIRSKPSRGRPLWSKSHLIGCPVCGFVSVEHPNRGLRGCELARGQGKSCLSTLVSCVIIGTVVRSNNGTVVAKAFFRSSLLPASFRSSHRPSLPPCRQPLHPCFLIPSLVPGTW